MRTPPPSLPQLDVQSEAMFRNTRQSTQLRRLTLRTLDQPRPIVNIDAATGQGPGSHKEKFHNYLGVVAREKIPIEHKNWKDVPDSLKDLVWDDILVSDVNIEVYFFYLVTKVENFEIMHLLQNNLLCRPNLISHKHRMQRKRSCQLWPLDGGNLNLPSPPNLSMLTLRDNINMIIW